MRKDIKIYVERKRESVGGGLKTEILREEIKKDKPGKRRGPLEEGWRETDGTSGEAERNRLTFRKNGRGVSEGDKLAGFRRKI